MSDTSSSVEATAATGTWFQRNYFLLRRLHSLTGILPIGVFLIMHLTTNSSILWGKWALRGEEVHGNGGWFDGGIHYFVKEVNWINEQIPHLLIIEIVLWASIAFHSILGVIYALQGKSNTRRYAYQDNWRYTLQRWSGYIGIFFIFYHVATLRWGWTWLVPGGAEWSHHAAASTLAAALQGGVDGKQITGLIVACFYMLGVSMLVFHFVNGLWTAAITWGITISLRSQRRWGKACFGLGVVLMLMAWSTVITFYLVDYRDAQVVEKQMGPVEKPVEAAAETAGVLDAHP